MTMLTDNRDKGVRLPEGGGGQRGEGADVIGPGLDVREVEKVLASVGSMVAARIVTDPGGRIIEIHGLANSDRSPKQLIRDIESTLMARFGLRVDHKKIGIAQLQDEDELKKDLARRRLKIKNVSVTVSGTSAEALVELELTGKVYSGTASGGGSVANRNRLLAVATLLAVESFLRARNLFAVDDVIFQSIGGRKAVVVCVTVLVPSGEECLFGGAVVKTTEGEAVVRATLDAINRRIAILGKA